MRPRSRDDFAIAIICALPLEADAVEALFDKTYDRLGKYYGKQQNDANAYINGRISKHDVVLCYMPGMGKGSAASVASSLVVSYPGVRLALVVGICAGAPPPPKYEEIFLGDVIISDSVIEYDFGRQYPGGFQQKTGVKDTLGRPGREIRTLLNSLRAENARRELQDQTRQYLHSLEQTGTKWCCPRVNDILFNAHYLHKHYSNASAGCSCFGSNLPEQICEEALGKDCNELHCDQGQQVRCRENPEAIQNSIYIGPVASADTVMKSAQHRDEIVKREKVIGFEMEGAGVWDDVPCIIIKGVCDYADSHKSKLWQAYAAATGASAAKAFLEYWRPVASEGILQESQYLSEEERACLRSLFITDPAEDKSALKRRKGERASGTCTWFLETVDFQHWLEPSKAIGRDNRGILWLYGNPGTGKSTIATTIAEELPRKPYFQNENKFLGYFFCDSSSENNRTATAILRGLLYQLIKQRPILLHRYLLPKYAERRNKLFGSFDALWAVFWDIGMNEDLEIYCVLDALDECEIDSQKTLLEQINQTFNTVNTNYECCSKIHILVTSRPYYEIRRHLASFTNKDLATYEAVSKDLAKVIQQRVEFLSKQNGYPKSVAMKISQILEVKAEGTFLWVGIACDELAQVQSRNAVQALQALPQGLDSLYHKLLDTATATCSKDDERVIFDILNVVAFALRPLTVKELSEVCQLYPTEEEDCRIQFTEEYIDLCRLMIVIHGSHVRLLHQSVKDFLLREAGEIDSLNANAALARRCISRIIQSSESEITNDSDPKRGFLNYSVFHWLNHTSLSGTDLNAFLELADFFLLESTSWAKWLRLYNSLQRYHLDRLDVGFSILHAAARWGVPQLIHYALSCTNLDPYGDKSSRATKLLVDVNFKTAKGVTPLAEAARCGQLESVRCLLEKGPRDQEITEEVIKAAAENIGTGVEVIYALLEWCSNQFQDSMKLKSAVVQGFDRAVVAFLFSCCEGQIVVTEDMIRCASRNIRHGREIITLIIERYRNEIQDSTQLTSAVIQNFDEGVVSTLLKRGGGLVRITEDIFRAAARHYHNENVVLLLLDHFADHIHITMAAGLLDIHYPSSTTNCEHEYADSRSCTTWQTYAAITGWDAAVKNFSKYLRWKNRQAGERYWNVPFERNRNVTGVDRISEIEELYMKQDNPRIIAICGLGGVGKTQIAIELAYRMQIQDPKRSIFWISCTISEIFDQTYTNIANMLGFHDLDAEEAKYQVSEYLSSEEAGKWLLIFDNADDVFNMVGGGSIGMQSLQTLLPNNEQGYVIFTTRNSNLAVELPSAKVIHVSGLDAESAMEILRNSLDVNVLLDYDTSLDLLQQLAFHPLAITQATAYIRESGIAISDYVQLLLGKEEELEKEEDAIKLLSEGFQKEWQDTDASELVAAAWLISFEQIRQTSQLGAAFLLFMACINSHDIPQSLLPPALTKEKVEALNLLKAFSFVSEGRDGSLTSHRLFHLSARNWMRKRDQFSQEISKAAHRLSEVFPSDDHTNRELWRVYLPHALSLTREQEFVGQLDKYTDLIQKICRCLASDGRYNEAEVLGLQAMVICKEKLGPVHPDTLASVSQLGSILVQQGKYEEAETMHQEAIKGYEKVLGPEHPNTLICVSKLGSILEGQGKYKEAEAMHQQALQGYKKVLGPEHPDTFISMASLATMYFDQGRLVEAEELEIQVL
ncbi:uncharacterized protein BDV14DRAFT_204484, partial [Aspergillus stella-maris]|uniref:uncharacterized protein n=1 Tax=Aspergillus stella-maris TaxID=1810926 RepID=UPI003CCD5126